MWHLERWFSVGLEVGLNYSNGLSNLHDSMKVTTINNKNELVKEKSAQYYPNTQIRARYCASLAKEESKLHTIQAVLIYEPWLKLKK